MLEVQNLTQRYTERLLTFLAFLGSEDAIWKAFNNSLGMVSSERDPYFEALKDPQQIISFDEVLRVLDIGVGVLPQVSSKARELLLREPSLYKRPHEFQRAVWNGVLSDLFSQKIANQVMASFHTLYVNHAGTQTTHYVPESSLAYLVGSTHAEQFSGSSESVYNTRVEAKYKDKKEVSKAEGKGTTTVYEYGPRQVHNRNKAKAEKVEKLRKSISDLRAKYRSDLTAKDEKTRFTALAIGLIDVTFERVGNDESASKGHFGVTGWRAKHIKVSQNKATIRYTGKSGVKQHKEVSDSHVLKALKTSLQGKGPEDSLCAGSECRIEASDVNAYLDPFGITAKDLRGYHANVEMQNRLQSVDLKSLPEGLKERKEALKDAFQGALDETASLVGHEASTLKGQYLVPGLEENFLKDGSVVRKLDQQKKAIYHVDNAFPEPKDQGPMSGHAGLFSSLTYYEQALIRDMIHTGDMLQGSPHEGWSFRGYDLDLSAVQELIGSGWLTQYMKGASVIGVSVSHMAQAKMTLYKEASKKQASWLKVRGFFNLSFPLFHATKGTRVTEILKEGLKSVPSRNNPAQSGISMSRDLSFLLKGDFGNVIFVFDGNQLKQNLKTTPHQHPGWVDEFEERVHGNIPPSMVRGVIFNTRLMRSERSWYKEMFLDFPVLYRTRSGWSSLDSQTHTATKSESEKEDAEAERLIRRNPKKNPPRKDLRRNRVKVEDGDMQSFGAEGDRDLSLNFKKVARKKKVRRNPGDVWRSTKGKWVGMNAEKNTNTFGKTPADRKKAEAYAKGTQDPTEKDAQEQLRRDTKLEERKKDRAQFRQDAITALEGVKDLPEEVRDTLTSQVSLKGRNDLLRVFKTQMREMDARISSGITQEMMKSTKKDPFRGVNLKDPTQVSEALVQSLVRDRILLNPSYLGGKSLSPTMQDSSVLVARGVEAMRQYRNLSPKQLQSVARKAQSQLDAFDEDDPRRDELEAIIDGMYLASIQKGYDFPTELRDPPHKNYAALTRRLAVDSPEILLAQNQDDLYSDKARIAVQTGLDSLLDESIVDMAEGSYLSPLGDLLGDSELGQEERDVVRGFMQEMMLNDMTTFHGVTSAVAHSSADDSELGSVNTTTKERAPTNDFFSKISREMSEKKTQTMSKLLAKCLSEKNPIKCLEKNKTSLIRNQAASTVSYVDNLPASKQPSPQNISVALSRMVAKGVDSKVLDQTWEIDKPLVVRRMEFLEGIEDPKLKKRFRDMPLDKFEKYERTLRE